VFAGVQASVVQRQRGATDEFLGEEQIVLLERHRVLGADEQCHPQQDASRANGYDHQGVHAVLPDLPRPYRVPGDPGARSGVQDRLQMGPSAAQDLGHG
jgi:hypothetical protein